MTDNFDRPTRVVFANNQIDNTRAVREAPTGHGDTGSVNVEFYVTDVNAVDFGGAAFGSRVWWKRQVFSHRLRRSFGGLRLVLCAACRRFRR